MMIRTSRTLSAIAAFAFLLSACGPPPPDQRTPTQTTDRPAPTPVPRLESDVRDTAYFLNRYVDIRWMATSPVTEVPIQRSSQHPDRGVSDFRTVVREETIDGQTWKVLFDEEGPGCMTRIFMSASTPGTIRFYFDNEDTPRLSLPIQDFFTGTSEAFPYRMLYVNEQMAQDFVVSTGSYTSYMPMPYAERLKIAIQTDAQDLYYQINALQLDDSKEVVSFTPDFDQQTQNALQAANDSLHRIRYNQIPESSKRKVTKTLPPGEKVLMDSLTGPAALEFFDIVLEPSLQAALEPARRDEILDSLRLEFYWDLLEVPGVSTTLRQFMGNVPSNVESWSSYFTGMDLSRNLYFSNFYMPYTQSAQLFMVNSGETPVTVQFSYLVDVARVPESPMYFLASASRREGMFLGTHYPRLNFEGEGRLIGSTVALDSAKLNETPFVLEGDDNIFLNGEAKPSMRGTGIDHFFNWTNQFMQTQRFWCPLYGCYYYLNDGERTQTANYRWMLLDSIPFQSSFLMVQEMGDANQFFQGGLVLNETATLTMTHYWYASITPQERAQRQEQVFYFTITNEPEGAPTIAHPVFMGINLNMHLPVGDWYVHLAPIWNIQQVQTIHNPVTQDQQFAPEEGQQ